MLRDAYTTFCEGQSFAAAAKTPSTNVIDMGGGNFDRLGLSVAMHILQVPSATATNITFALESSDDETFAGAVKTHPLMTGNGTGEIVAGALLTAPLPSGMGKYVRLAVTPAAALSPALRLTAFVANGKHQPSP